MTRFGPDDDLRGAEFVEADLEGARFRLSRLTGARIQQTNLYRAVLRGADLTDADVDGEIDGLRLNGVEVAPLIVAELHRRYPGWGLARSDERAEQRLSFVAARRAWDATLERVAAMPAGTVDVQVDDEWSVAQTLRHLVFAVDGWLRFGIQVIEDAFHPCGVPFSEWDPYAALIGIDLGATPSWDEVLVLWADRMAQVGDAYDTFTDAEFAAPARRLPPWESDDAGRSVSWCLGIVVNELWAHHRFVQRDLDTLAADGLVRPAPGPGT